MSFHLTLEENDYPRLLKAIHDPPARLWGEGDSSALSEGPHIAVVGARECTPYGEEIAFEISKGLVDASLVVVSGLAYGIDTAAHRGALAGGGWRGGEKAHKTVAVLGCGLDVPYPSENLELKKRIAKNGAVISEFSPGTRAAPWTFPQRNRIISGLSLGVVVIEAGEKSGALITVELALQQGREVFAVPGNVTSRLSRGTNHLIQQGAKLVTSVSDILEELRLEAKLKSAPVVIDFSSEEGKVLHFLSEGPRHMDELVNVSGCSVEKMSSLLVELEMNGKIKSLPGGRFRLCQNP